MIYCTILYCTVLYYTILYYNVTPDPPGAGSGSIAQEDATAPSACISKSERLRLCFEENTIVRPYNFRFLSSCFDPLDLVSRWPRINSESVPLQSGAKTQLTKIHNSHAVRELPIFSPRKGFCQNEMSDASETSQYIYIYIYVCIHNMLQYIRCYSR